MFVKNKEVKPLKNRIINLELLTDLYFNTKSSVKKIGQSRDIEAAHAPRKFNV